MSDPPDRTRLDILLKDYELARLDERNLNATQATAFNVTVAVIGLMAANISSETHLPDPMLAAAPLLPLALLAYLQMLGTVATIRSYYMRGLERELRTYAGPALSALGDVPAPALADLSLVIGSLRRGSWRFRAMANLILGVITVAFGGLTIYIGWRVVESPAVQIGMLAVYVPLAVLFLGEAARSSIGGRTLYTRTAQAFLDSEMVRPLPVVTLAPLGGEAGPPQGPAIGGAMPRSSRERRLFSYLLYPRPEDSIKLAFAPVSFLCAAWSTGEWGGWLPAMGVWFVLEYLIYLARYQWNDVRGIEDDQRHAERKSRGRLPGGGSPGRRLRNIRISLAVAFLRLLAAVGMGWLIGHLIVTCVLLALVLGIALLYEALRSRSAKIAAEAASGNRDPLRPNPTTAALWFLVSLGYAVRSGAGFYLGGLGLTDSALVFGVVSIAAYGMMFVLMTWVLEATSFCRHQLASASADDAPWYRLDELARKPHIGALLTFAGIKTHNASGVADLPVEPVGADDAAYCGRHPILAPRGRVRAPWNVGLVVGVLAGAMCGMLLAETGAGGTKPFMASILITVVGLVLLILGNVFWSILGCVAATIAICVTAVAADAEHAPLAAVPWAILGITYLVFRNSSYHELKFFAKERHPLRRVMLVLVGKQTAEAVGLTRSHQ